MGFMDKIGAVFPTQVFSTAAEFAGDYMSKMAQKRENSKARESNLRLNAENIAMQKEFAQNGVRWRVNDAISAGLHPLAAIGAQGASYSPTSISQETDRSSSDFLSRTGQNISRAISATRTINERKMAALQLEGAQLDNDYKRALIINMGRTGPSFPGGNGNFMGGQGDSDGLLMDIRPVKKNVSQPLRPAQEAGWRPDVSYSRTDTGMAPVIPEGLSESLEDDMVGKILWRVRNQFLQNFDSTSGKPPANQLPRGYVDWHWSRTKQEWQPVRSKLKFNWRRGDFLPNGGN